MKFKNNKLNIAKILIPFNSKLNYYKKICKYKNFKSKELI